MLNIHFLRERFQFVHGNYPVITLARIGKGARHVPGT